MGKIVLIAVLALCLTVVLLPGEAGAFASPLCSPLPGYEELPCRPLPPTRSPAPVPERTWAYVGLWWRGPESACELYSDGLLYRVECP